MISILKLSNQECIHSIGFIEDMNLSPSNKIRNENIRIGESILDSIKKDDHLIKEGKVNIKSTNKVWSQLLNKAGVKFNIVDKESKIFIEDHIGYNILQINTLIKDAEFEPDAEGTTLFAFTGVYCICLIHEGPNFCLLIQLIEELPKKFREFATNIVKSHKYFKNDNKIQK